MWVLVVAAASAYLTKCWQKASKKQSNVQKISGKQNHSSGESSDSQVDKGGLSRISSKFRDTKEFSHKYAKSGERGQKRGSLLVKEKSGVQRLRGFGSWKRKGLLCREASVVVSVISIQKSSSNLSSSASFKSPKTFKSSSNICSDCNTVVLASKRQDFPVQSPSESIVPKKKELSMPLNLNDDLGHCASPSECFSSQLQTGGKQIFVFDTQPAHKGGFPEVRKRKGRANVKTRQRQPKSCENVSINIPERERGKEHCLTDLSEQGMSYQTFNLVPLLNKKRKLADYVHLPFRKRDVNNALENSKETSRELVMFLAGLQLGLFCSFIPRDLKQHSHHHIENVMTNEKQSCMSAEGGYGATTKCICEEVDDNESVKSVVTAEAVSNHRMSDLEAELVAEFELMQHNFNPKKHPQPYSRLGDLEDPNDFINIFPDETSRSGKSNKSDPAYEKIHTGISPSELEKRLHMVLVERYEATIAELEACIQVAESQLLAKERELHVWKDHVYQLTNSSLSASLG